MKKNKFRKRLLFMAILSFLVAIFNGVNIYGYELSETKDGIESFPQDYQYYLNELHKKYPNWKFKSVYTKLDFNYVVSEELKNNRSLIEMNSFSNEWKRDTIQIEPGWVNASEYAVRYFLDPRNFLNEEKIFQFESTEFNKNAQTADVIEQILAGTGLANANYYINAGNKVDLGSKFSDVIYSCGNEKNVSAVHLASRIIQETGASLGTLENGKVKKDSNGNVLYFNGRYWVVASRSINGSYVSERYGDFRGVYNFFNIGSYCTANCGWCGNPFVHGLERAKTLGWTTPKKAILAAAEYLRNNWIKYGQNTIYFEKFDVNFVPGSVYLFGSQYMANISAASSESSLMYKGYKATGKINQEFTFYIPVYNNMTVSENATPKRVQVIDCEGSYLNMRKEKGTDAEIIAKLENGTVLTQIYDDGTSWLKVKLDDGTEGYVYREYIADYNSKEIAVSKISTEKSYNVAVGKYLTVKPTITPSNATNKTFEIKVEDTSVAKLENGKIKGLKEGKTNVTLKTKDGSNLSCKFELQVKKEVIEVSDKLALSDDGIITKIKPETKVSSVVQNIKTDYKVKLYSVDDKELTNDDIVTTDTKVIIYDNDKKLYEYKILIKADTNCDGKINSADLLKIVQYLKGKTTLTKEAADLNSDNVVNSADLLKVVQYLKGKTTIEF